MFDFKDVDKQKKVYLIYINNNQQKTKGAPKNQQKQNQLLYSEMQHFRVQINTMYLSQSVISNEKVKEDPYDSVRQYLEARIQSQKM